VLAGGREYTADYLVLAPGAELAPAQVPGLAEAGHNLYDLAGAMRIREECERLESGSVAVLVARTPFKCPAAPYEAAMLLLARFQQRSLTSHVSVSVYSPEPGPMPVTGPETSAKVRSMVEATGVRYFPQHRVLNVDPAGRLIRFESGVEAQYDLLVYVPPHVSPAIVREAGMAETSGWVPVDRSTMETRFPDVFAIGDVTTVPLKSGLPLPKAGTFAHGQAKAVAAIIAGRARARPARARFDGFGECFIETGRGRAGMGRGNFYAEPAPAVRLRTPAKRWHWSKVLFEKWWLRKWM
jgi:sulfide:quinone oxidoreductase